MVRFKKRYFVVQLDREKDIYDPFSKHHQASLKPRAIQDSRPLDIPDGVLAATIKDLVQQIHGDFGRASITTGLRTIYCNSETHLVLIQCRHGPHRLVASSLPFLTKIKDEKIVPKLIYTGATIKNCYKRMEKYQRRQLRIALKELKNIDEDTKKSLEERLMTIRNMH
jgi:ribonuclease P/MRP protein subunit POP5